MPKTHVLACALLLLVLAPATARGNDAATADAVVAAHEAGDTARLAELAKPKGLIDPWRVVDVLLEGGRAEVAAAYAAQAKGKDLEALGGYVETWRAKPIDKPSREAAAAARMAVARSDFEAAFAAFDRVADTAHPVLRVRVAHGRAESHLAMRQYMQASAAYLQMAEIAEGVGWLQAASGASQQAGLHAFRTGAFREARRIWRFRLEVEQRRGSPIGEAAAFANIGLTHWRLGNLPKALTHITRASEVFLQQGRRGPYGSALTNIGVLHKSMGNYPQALDYSERARRLFTEIGHKPGVIASLGNLANIYDFMGDPARARALYEEALALEPSGRQAAKLMHNAAIIAMNDGRGEDAEDLITRARTILEKTAERVELASLIAALGDLRVRQGRDAESIPLLEEAIKIAEELGAKREATDARASLAVPLHRVGRHAEAIAMAQRAIRESERLRASRLTVSTLGTLAWMQMVSGDHEATIATARRAVPHFERVVRGNAQEHGTRLRERHVHVYQYATLAAAALDDAAESCFFLESGRAGSLLEAMGGRDALRVSLPDALIESETLARRAELAAQAAYDQASAGGKRKAIRAARQQLDQARDALRTVIANIQRHEKQHTRTQLFYPTPITIEELQDALGPREAFVTYGVFEYGSIALVVTPDAARVVPLGPTPPIAEACAALDLGKPSATYAEPLAALAKLSVEPLALGKDVQRVLVSPSGPLSYVPSRLLFGEREVVCQPSGTVYIALQEDRPLPGTRVLALGDPAYDTEVQAPAIARLRGGTKLARLPATRDEAKAVGDVVLLGAEASRAGLVEALGKASKRWRAVHIACHGLVNPTKPTLSSLALTPAEDDTGFLTALDVFHMEIPTDLAVLSACETGKGRIVAGEGIVGLTHSFLRAGASGVLTSLWKVDDEATRALMTKFYELWSPDDGKGISAAAALRAAQDHVRAQEKWKHPYYWAAWVLWGLAD
ncbi:MAG: CHAT domain-containing tetratricopeptide repeat protein [Planctomycetota bacterium]|nr:CHAT domain-containing tetratricopeptide repeat protein [Planctomycetota bacterium]